MASGAGRSGASADSHQLPRPPSRAAKKARRPDVNHRPEAHRRPQANCPADKHSPEKKTRLPKKQKKNRPRKKNAPRKKNRRKKNHRKKNHPKEEPPEEEEGPGDGCALYASASGKDGNDGTQGSPLRTVHALLGKLGRTDGMPGAGQVPRGHRARRRLARRLGGAGDDHLDQRGSAGDDLGRIVTLPGADWLTFSHLTLTDSAVTYPSVTIGSAHTSWMWNDVSAPNTICFQPVGPGKYGPGEHTLIEHNRIHNCGQPFLCDVDAPPCNQPPNDGYHLHGTYDGGNFTTVRNNYIYENSSKGVLLRSGTGAVVQHNVIDGNGSGVFFGDLAPEGDTVAWNIITNSHGICETCFNYFGIWSFGSVGPGNTATHNDVFGNASGNFGLPGGVKLKENIEVDPLYVDAAKHDYTLRPDSPVLGYGPE